MVGTPDGPGDPTDRERCDFCRMPIPLSPVTAEFGGETYAFCCQTCRDAMAEADHVFTEYRGHRWLRAGISVLDAQLPQGLLRSSFVLLSGSAGTRDAELYAELVWRTLERGEPAVFVTFGEPPVSVVERFLTLDWNVLPYLERGQLHILDCFTYRMGDRDRMLARMDDWNRHLHEIAAPATSDVHDPADVSQVEAKLDGCLETLGMVDTGIVLIDSLTEFGTLLQPIRAYNLVKDLRADVCKGRFVPIFAGATLRSEADEFPHDLEYAVDGVVDLRLASDVVENTLIKQIRVRKMSGVLAIPEWTAYEFTGGDGLVGFDPTEQLDQPAADRTTDDDSRDGAAGEPTGPDRTP